VPPSSARRSRLSEGLPYPLGATWDGLGVNFALFPANATKVELCLSTRAAGARSSDARPGTLYGYRVHGPMSLRPACAAYQTAKEWRSPAIVATSMRRWTGWALFYPISIPSR
jgi:pullulanase/glycogen debranching enzyme